MLCTQVDDRPGDAHFRLEGVRRGAGPLRAEAVGVELVGRDAVEAQTQRLQDLEKPR